MVKQVHPVSFRTIKAACFAHEIVVDRIRTKMRPTEIDDREHIEIAINRISSFENDQLTPNSVWHMLDACFNYDVQILTVEFRGERWFVNAITDAHVDEQMLTFTTAEDMDNYYQMFGSALVGTVAEEVLDNSDFPF